MTQYVIVIRPSKEISSFTEKFFADFSLFRHTTLPPHLTLLPPFEINDISGEKFFNILTSETYTNFPIELVKVDIFKGRNNVIFLAPDKNSNEKIFFLYQKILNLIKPYINLDENSHKESFQSHLTLAKHIPDKDFNSVLFEAKKSFSLPLSFVCSGYWLYKNSGHGWNLVSEVKFIGK